MRSFEPDYTNVIDAAKNMKTRRIPLYEHIISENVMEKIMRVEFTGLINGDSSDKAEFFRHYNGFFKEMGYDTVSFEQCIGPAMPGSGALGQHKPGVIKTYDDFSKYPWDEIPGIFFNKYGENFSIMGEHLPWGMKAIGGPGNGVFELVQDVVGFENLCLISYDDPELYKGLFEKVGEMMYRIWSRFLEEFGDYYAVCRFGDNLGFKNSTLLPPKDIRQYIIPQYERIIKIIHSYNKPFLFHCCGNIFEVMDDIIDKAKIDAKHSNEDQIAPFSKWMDMYGDKIGVFGGVDTDHLCRKNKDEIRDIVKDVFAYCKDKGGFALGSGNSIPDYVPPEGYLAMVETARQLRGD
ncbi:MAG: hypothetical protein GX754_10650 [Clostridiaceae bacterium]|nr:hypothetical protein [Clostridiaceae bacterium]